MSVLRVARYLLVAALPMFGQTPVKSDSILSYSRIAGGVDFQTRRGVLSVRFSSETMIHVLFRPGNGSQHPQPWITRSDWPTVRFTLAEDARHDIILGTGELRVIAERDSSALVFEDGGGRVLLRESNSPAPRELEPGSTEGERFFRVSSYFDLTTDEALYGLGQRQSGLLNQRGTDLLLMQDNTNITVPFLLSSRGYGLLWNSASLGGYENHFQPKLALRSEMADGVDYYFLYGPQCDRIIASYRELTGAAPLMPLWAYGFWQSRYQYSSQREMLEVAAKYRELKIPLDNLVLDSGWMERMGWQQFSASFPDPPAMLRTLRQMHVRTMISVWPFYTPPSANFDEMLSRSYFVTGGRTQLPTFYPGSRLLDAFNPDARRLFWQQLRSGLFDKGVEAWWLDSSEPLDSFGEAQGPILEGAHTALGSGTRYANSYPFFETKAVFEGQRAATGVQRVFILTRSAFLGQQSHAAASWSGDIAPTFDSLRRQIPAGLNFSLSGLPYWTTDIGGFQGGDPNDPAYQEVYVRWFEYGTFCPVFRTHGARPANELWSYGPRAQQILVLYDELRYRLIPYIYSLAWKTTSEGYTPMRALVMDFAGDRRLLDIADEFMFGPSLLVNPVTQPGATTRKVYLPSGPAWYDFWTGASLEGGRGITAPAPMETIPLYVRAGSIVPLGPDMQYTGQRPEDPIELRIYPGADGQFTLYEDDGLSYAYEKGEHASITFTWKDSPHILGISARSGSFPGVLRKRVFRVVLVRPDHGVGESDTLTADRILDYGGEAVTVRFVDRP